MTAPAQTLRTPRRRATISLSAESTHVDVLNRLIEVVGGQTALSERMTELAAEIHPGEGRRYSPNTLCNWQRRGGVPMEHTRILRAQAKRLRVEWPEHLPVWMPPGAAV